jgi:AcrR family transcriptional regulator
VADGLFAPSERERLIEAMAGCCAERGYQKTTVEEIIARAGVPAKAFATNFAGKEECGLAAINQVLAESAAVASGAWSADSSEWESIVRGVRAMLEMHAARPSFAFMAFIGSRQMMPTSAWALYQSGMQILASMIDRLRADSPKEAPQPASAARGAIGSSEILIRREVLAGRSERLPELLPDLIFGALVPFLGQEEALRQYRLARELLAAEAG